MRHSLLPTLLLVASIATAADVPLANPHYGPAPFGREDVFAASNGRGFLVVSREYRWGSYALLGMRADLDGRPLDNNMLPIAHGLGLTPAGLASDGDTYLLAYVVDTFPGPLQLRFAQIDDRGIVLRSGSLPGSPIGASLAWGGSAYVIASQGKTPAATVVAFDGTVLRSAIPIVKGIGDDRSFHLSPGPDGNVIGTWSGNDDRVHAVVVPTAALRDGTWSAPVADESGPPSDTFPSPAIVASGGNQSLVVWCESSQSDGAITTIVRGRRLNAGGNAVGVPFFIAQIDGEGYQYVRLSAAWTGSRFVVAYSRLEFPPRGSLISIGPDDQPATLQQFSNPSHPVWIALAGSDHGALFVWPTTQLNGVFIAPSGTTAGDIQLFAPAFAAQLEPKMAWCGDAHRAVWTEHSDRARIVFGHVRAGGIPADAEGFYVSDSPRPQTAPNIACNATNALVVWSETQPDVITARAALVDPEGTPQPAIDLGRAYDGAPAVVWNGKEYLTAWRSAETQRIVLLRVSRDGQPVDPFPIDLPTGRSTVTDLSPSLAWNGSEYLVVWAEELSAPANAHAIDALRLTRDLTPIGSTRDVSVRPGADASAPLVINGNGEWFITWVPAGGSGAYARLAYDLSNEIAGTIGPGAGNVTDATFADGAYQVACGGRVLSIGSQDIAPSLRDVVALSHGGTALLPIFSRVAGDDALPRLFIPAGVNIVRPRAIRH